MELTVGGSGSLTVIGNHNAYGAAIGSNAGEDAGSITIDGGSFVFQNMNAGAGIGTGSGNAKVNIVINGGSFDVAMDIDDSGYNGNLAYCGAAIGTGNAASGGWSSPYKTMKITINGGDFTGYTHVDSPIIGVANGSGSLNAVIDINGGTFDLLTEDKSENTMTGGACIGSGTQGYYGNVVPDITINGGIIHAVSKSNGAAIGGGPGQDGGNIYIFGGTITAVSEFEADAIGAGTASPQTSNNVRISGGTVKTVSIGTGLTFRDSTLTNDDSDAVFLVNIEAPDVTSVTVNGRDWGICANHPGDPHLYLYLPSATEAHEVVVNDADKYLVTVMPNGKVTVEKDESVTVDFSNLIAVIEACETYIPDAYTSDSWAALQAALEAARAVVADPDATQEEVNEALTNLTAAQYGLVARGDKAALQSAADAAAALDERNYTFESWTALCDALEEANEVLADPDATQDEINAAELALTQAVAALVWYVDKSDLEKRIAEVDTYLVHIAEEVFPEDLWKDLAEALANAKAVLADEGADWHEVKDAEDALDSAFRSFQAYEVNSMYTDVPRGQWYYDAVDFVTRYGIMNGMDAGAFNPGGNVNRAQFVTILYRIAGSPAVTIDNPFVDVPAQSWYTDAVLWAYEKGITTGATATTFNPGGTLVRQNMVTFLMRFANTMGIDTSDRADLSGYNDAYQIAAHAQAPMEWAVARGIISGMSETTLGPNGLANRAQIAVIIERFVPDYLW